MQLFTKGFAVEGGEAVFFDEAAVEESAISFVNFKSIFLIFFGETTHQSVATDFDDNGSTSNKDIFTIAPHNCFLISVFLWRSQ